MLEKNRIKKIGLISFVATLLISYNVIISNMLKSKQSEFSTRYISLIAIIIFIGYEILTIIKNIKEKQYKKTMIEAIFILLASLIIFKYFNDNVKYFKDNNLTNLLIQSLFIIKVFYNTLLIKDSDKKNKLAHDLIIILTTIIVFIFQVTKYGEYNIINFYLLGIFVNITILFTIIFDKKKEDKKNIFNISYILVLLFNLIYYIMSLILLRKGAYKITYVMLFQKTILYGLINLFIFKTITKKNIISKSNIANIINITIFTILLLTLMYIPKKQKDYNIFLIINNLSILIVTLINKRKDIFKKEVVLALVLVILIISQIFLITNKNQIYFMLISMLVMISIIILNLFIKIKDKDLIRQ